MSDPFNPYHVWLGIPPEEQPPHHYRLLGISLFESNARVIAIAAQRQMAHVKTFAVGEHAEATQSILNELVRAKLCLMDPAKKAAYDQSLKQAAGKPDKTPVGPAQPVVATPPAGRKGKSPATPAKAPVSQPGAAAPAIVLPDLPADAMHAWTVGSGHCDLVVRQPGVAPLHGRLIQTPTLFLLEDLDSGEGIFLNGKRITARIPVCASDAVTLGPSAKMVWPPGMPQKVRLIRIGAGPDNDVVLDLPMISWRHAVLRFEPGGVILEDLGSTNGTSIGKRGNRVRQAKLGPNDIVFFGSYSVPAAKLARGG